MTSLIVLIAATIAVAIIVTLCAAGAIPRNIGIGIRIPATRASAEAWRTGHRAALLPAYAGGLIGIILALCFLAFGPDSAFAPIIVAGVLVLTLLLAAYRANRAASRVGPTS